MLEEAGIETPEELSEDIYTPKEVLKQEKGINVIKTQKEREEEQKKIRDMYNQVLEMQKQVQELSKKAAVKTQTPTTTTATKQQTTPTTTTTTPTTTTQTPTKNQQQYKEITVKKGETLSGISQRELGATSRYKEIADINKIEDPNKIKEGQVLKIPLK